MRPERILIVPAFINFALRHGIRKLYNFPVSPSQERQKMREQPLSGLLRNNKKTPNINFTTF
jgi:hypothetical protein